MNDANNAGTLAPCPFCKSRCVTATRDEHGWKIVECDDCGARGPCIDLDGDQYIDRWNALSTPNAPVEQREATTSKMEVVQQREAIGLALRRFHQSSCYPQASDGEIDIAIAAILAVRLDEAVIRKDEREKFGFVQAMDIAERGFETWAAKDHNAKWVRRIDGTPIKNDLLVNIAEAFRSAIRNGGKQP